MGVEESSNPEHAALDPAGQILSIIFLGALTLSLIGAGESGWNFFEIIGPLAISLLALLAFIAVEMRSARPVLPIDLLRQRAFAFANFASFVLGFSGYSSLFLLSLFLQKGQGWTATEAGWRMAPVFVAMLAVSSCFGRLTLRFGIGRLMVAGYVLIGGSMLVMISFTSLTAYHTIAPVFVLLGIGQGLAVPSTGAAVMGSAPRERTGAASATMNALRQGGMTIGIALLGTIMGARAMTSLETILAKSGVGDVALVAAAAVQRHQAPQNLSIAPKVFKAMLAEAFTQGFSLAVAVSGVLGLAAAVMLAFNRFEATRISRDDESNKLLRRSTCAPPHSQSARALPTTREGSEIS
jgi:MFS family permease